jgi:serine O-acetyltransferase
MIERFRMDAARWIIPQRVGDPAQVTVIKALTLLWNYPPLQAMLLFRLGCWFKARKIPLTGIIQRLITVFYGLEIRVGADVGGGLYIPHPIGMVIAAERIGTNCTIIHNVTIGMRKEHAFPTLGDSVFIGAGARVLGGIHIASGAVIGANAVVIDDVPAGATVVGIPARPVRRKPKVHIDAKLAKEGELSVEKHPQLG